MKKYGGRNMNFLLNIGKFLVKTNSRDLLYNIAPVANNNVVYT